MKKVGTLNILGQVYTVWRTGRLASPGMQDYYGSVDHILQKIYLNKDNRPSQEGCTLLHEVLHVLDAHLGLDLGEERVKPVAVALFDMMTRNPEPFRRIMRGRRPFSTV